MRPLSICEWYGAAVGFSVAACIVGRLLVSLAGYIAQKWTHYVHKHIIYPQLWYRLMFVGGMTRLEMALLILSFAANGFCMGFQVSSMTEASSRAGILSTINLVPLLVGSRLSTASDLLGLTDRTHLLIHRWCRAVRRSNGIQPVFSASLSALGCTLATLGVCLPFFRRRMYEVFLRAHFTLTLVISFALWRHLSLQRVIARFFILGGVCMWAILLSIRYISSCYRNIVWGRKLGRTSLTRLHDALLLEVTVPRSWKMKPGHYVYINIPEWHLGLSAPLQSHPFLICWWDLTGGKDGKKYHTREPTIINGDKRVAVTEDGEQGDNKNRIEHKTDKTQSSPRQLVLSILVQPRYGFTAKLYSRAHLESDSQVSEGHLTFISGPHGTTHNFGDYGAVLMFATGIGICAQLPHIKSLFDGYEQGRVRTRRIKIVWMVQRKEHIGWVNTWMVECLKKDTDHFLDVSVHVAPDQMTNHHGLMWDDPGQIEAYGTHNMMKLIWRAANVETYVRDEIQQKRGSLVVSVSVDPSVREKICKAVCEEMDDKVRLVELGQPADSLPKIH